MSRSTVWMAMAPAVLACVLAGCMIEAVYRGHLEVWNRTTTPISLGYALGYTDPSTIDVGPCGHVVEEDAVLNRFFLKDGQGRASAWLGALPPPGTVARYYLVVTASGATYAADQAPTASLPPCQGVLVGQIPDDEASP